MPIVSKSVHVSKDSKLSKVPEAIVLMMKMQLESIHGLSELLLHILFSEEFGDCTNASRTSSEGSKSLPRHGWLPPPQCIGLSSTHAFALECISFFSLKVHINNK